MVIGISPRINLSRWKQRKEVLLFKLIIMPSPGSRADLLPCRELFFFKKTL